MTEYDYTRQLARAYGSGECSCYDACPIGEGLLANIDGYSMEASLLPWMTQADWGWKATVAAVSDVLASGGRPLACMISLGLPNPTQAPVIVEAAGEACRFYDGRPGKGDFNAARRGGEWIDVAVVASTRRPVSRCNARPGDMVVQIGYAGYGLAARLLLDNIMAVDQVPRRVLDYTRRPTPPRQSWRITEGYATAAIDNSDGAGYSLALLASQSKVTMRVDRIIPDPQVEELLEEQGIGMEALAGSWEDYNIYATIPEDLVDEALKECKRLDVPCWIIGHTEEGAPGVYIGGKPYRGQGWNWTSTPPF